MTLHTTLEAVEPCSFLRPEDLDTTPENARRFLNQKVSDGKLHRVSRGLYYKGEETRWGMTQPRVRMAIAEILKGTSYGFTGYTATNYLNVAVTGERRPVLAGVAFYTRANPLRKGLSIMEITVLEILRSYPLYVGYSWDEVVANIKRNIALHNAEGTPAWKFDVERTAEAVEREKDRNTRILFDKFTSSL